MFPLRHGFLNNLAIDVFAGGLGLGELKELGQRYGFCGNLNHRAERESRAFILALDWWSEDDDKGGLGRSRRLFSLRLAEIADLLDELGSMEQ